MLITSASALQIGNTGSQGVNLIPKVTTNYSELPVYVNDSLYWQGHTGTDASWLTGYIETNPFDQSLNSTDTPTFAGLTINAGGITTDGSSIITSSSSWDFQNLFDLVNINNITATSFAGDGSGLTGNPTFSNITISGVNQENNDSVVLFGNTTGNPRLTFCGNTSSYSPSGTKIDCASVYVNDWSQLVFESPYSVAFTNYLGTTHSFVVSNNYMTIDSGYRYVGGSASYGLMYSGVKNAVHGIFYNSTYDGRYMDLDTAGNEEFRFYAHAKMDDKNNKGYLGIWHNNESGVIEAGKGDLILNATNISISNAFSYANYSVCYVDAGVLGHCESAVNETGGCDCKYN